MKLSAGLELDEAVARLVLDDSPGPDFHLATDDSEFRGRWICAVPPSYENGNRISNGETIYWPAHFSTDWGSAGKLIADLAQDGHAVEIQPDGDRFYAAVDSWFSRCRLGPEALCVAALKAKLNSLATA